MRLTLAREPRSDCDSAAPSGSASVAAATIVAVRDLRPFMVGRHNWPDRERLDGRLRGFVRRTPAKSLFARGHAIVPRGFLQRPERPRFARSEESRSQVTPSAGLLSADPYSAGKRSATLLRASPPPR